MGEPKQDTKACNLSSMSEDKREALFLEHEIGVKLSKLFEDFLRSISAVNSEPYADQIDSTLWQVIGAIARLNEIDDHNERSRDAIKTAIERARSNFVCANDGSCRDSEFVSSIDELISSSAKVLAERISGSKIQHSKALQRVLERHSDASDAKERLLNA